MIQLLILYLTVTLFEYMPYQTNISHNRRYALQQISEESNRVPSISIPGSPINNKPKIINHSTNNYKRTRPINKIFDSIEMPPEIRNFTDFNHINKQNRVIEDLNDKYQKIRGHMDQNDNNAEGIRLSSWINNHQKDQLCSSSHMNQFGHIQAVHSYISRARQRKSEVQDFLRAQETRVEDFQFPLTEQQFGQSLRKLKKVVRLMQIVCKLILGTECQQQNPRQSINSIYKQMTLSSMQSQSMEIYELELKNKDKQIKRLQKRIDALSKAEKSYDKSNIEDLSVLKSNLFPLSNTVNINDCALNLHQQSQTDELLPQLAQPYNLKLNLSHQYSCWTITQIQYKNKYGLCTKSSQTATTLKLSKAVNTTSETEEDQQEEQQHYMRRYKSVVKLCLYSLNLVVGLIIKNRVEKSKVDVSIVSEVGAQIQKFAQQFNGEYYSNKVNYNRQFCLSIKGKLKSLYLSLKQSVKL